MANDVVFQEAMDALREGNKAHARELLTGLIKEDQNNAEYWIWLSAAMDTAKERVYCLQTAFKLDPENSAAKRGLILHGAMPADETIQPFQMNRTRKWEEDLLLAHEKPKLKGWAAVKASPVTRLALIILLIGAVVSGVTFGFIIPAAERRAARPPTNTPGPSPTYTLTVTPQGGSPRTQAVGTPRGIAEDLGLQYTATPLYVEVERLPLISDYLLQFNSAFSKEEWGAAIEALQQAIEAEPDKAFLYYYLGEAHRFDGQPGLAQTAYNTALDKNPDFGPAYVGIARAQLQNNPNANVLDLLDDAIRLDPEFGEAYLERARVKTRDGDIQSAIADLGQANERMAGSPLVFFYLAQTRVQEGDFELALNAATRANELDQGHLPTYLLLGQIYAQTENYQEAIDTLNFYLKYAPNDASTYLLLGKIQLDTGDYEAAIQSMDEVIDVDRNRWDAYLYRLLANVELGNFDAAEADVDIALDAYPDNFEANLALVRIDIFKEQYGTAFLDMDPTLELAETNEEKAKAYYWMALIQEQRDEIAEAQDYWELLLDLPAASMTDEMRETADEHLAELGGASASTPTRTPTPTRTATPTRTPTP